MWLCIFLKATIISVHVSECVFGLKIVINVNSHPKHKNNTINESGNPALWWQGKFPEKGLAEV